MDEVDPITDAWVLAAARMGFEVRRSEDAWAAYDGVGTITVSDDGGLDADDSAAALILHELCHFATQGAASRALPDWGLNTADPGPEEHRREQSAVRVQRALLLGRGLEGRLAPTTEYRGSYEGLGEDPLEGDPLALAAFELLSARGWLPLLDEALRITADVPECGACGACCHAGFGALEIPNDDPFATQWPGLLAPTPEGGVGAAPGRRLLPDGGPKRRVPGVVLLRVRWAAIGVRAISGRRARLPRSATAGGDRTARLTHSQASMSRHVRHSPSTHPQAAIAGRQSSHAQQGSASQLSAAWATQPVGRQQSSGTQSWSVVQPMARPSSARHPQVHPSS